MRRVNIVIVPHRGLKILSFNLPEYILYIVVSLMVVITITAIWSSIGIGKNIQEINKVKRELYGFYQSKIYIARGQIYLWQNKHYKAYKEFLKAREINPGNENLKLLFRFLPYR